MPRLIDIEWYLNAPQTCVGCAKDQWATHTAPSSFCPGPSCEARIYTQKVDNIEASPDLHPRVASAHVYGDNRLVVHSVPRVSLEIVPKIHTYQ